MSDLADALLRIRHLVREQHTERLDDVAREIYDLTGEALAALMPSATSARSTHAIEAARSIVAASERERPGNDWWGVKIARRHVEGLLAEIDRLRGDAVEDAAEDETLCPGCGEPKDRHVYASPTSCVIGSP